MEVGKKHPYILLPTSKQEALVGSKDLEVGWIYRSKSYVQLVCRNPIFNVYVQIYALLPTSKQDNLIAGGGGLF